jgi:hypothetical protein
MAELTRVMVAGERTNLISAIHEQYIRGQGRKPDSEIKRDVQAALRWLPGAARDALSKARTILPDPHTRQARVGNTGKTRGIAGFRRADRGTGRIAATAE